MAAHMGHSTLGSDNKWEYDILQTLASHTAAAVTEQLFNDDDGLHIYGFKMTALISMSLIQDGDTESKDTRNRTFTFYQHY